MIGSVTLGEIKACNSQSNDRDIVFGEVYANLTILDSDPHVQPITPISLPVVIHCLMYCLILTCFIQSWSDYWAIRTYLLESA